VDPQTLFDITTKSFDWPSLLPPTGLFLFGVVLALMEKKNIGTFLIRKIGYVLCFAGLLTATYITANWFSKKHAASRALQTGKCSVVEGRVTNFHPMPSEGHSNESFTIEKEYFSYSDYVVTPCFNKSSSHGGPIRPDLPLRVSYSDDCILKIELMGQTR
jgi:hypothetical protein